MSELSGQGGGQYGEVSHLEDAGSSLQCVLQGKGEFQTLVP